MTTVTLLITASVALVPVVRSYSAAACVHLFFLHAAGAHVPLAVPNLGETIACAHSFQRQGVPVPTGVMAGGLFNLGRLIRESCFTLSLPNRHPTPFISPPGPKQILLRIAPDASAARIGESMRLAVGLMGSGHPTALWGFPAQCPPEVLELAQAFTALGGECLAVLPPERVWQVVLEV